MKSQVLHYAVWCNISGEAAGEIWDWSLLGVKGLNTSSIAVIFTNSSDLRSKWGERGISTLQRPVHTTRRQTNTVLQATSSSVIPAIELTERSFCLYWLLADENRARIYDQVSSICYLLGFQNTRHVLRYRRNSSCVLPWTCRRSNNQQICIPLELRRELSARHIPSSLKSGRHTTALPERPVKQINICSSRRCDGWVSLCQWNRSTFVH